MGKKRCITSRSPVQGVIVYDGPSVLDGGPIVAIATGLHHSGSNPKIGNMVQTFILRGDRRPVKAIYDGSDTSICGNCPHRRVHWGSCYVVVKRAPTSVWYAYQRGTYPPIDSTLLRHFEGRAIRLGAYGDPTVVPLRTWNPILRIAKRWTGYTHLWRTCHWRYRHLLMASCDSEEEQREATKRGWRTFRIRTPDEPILRGEVVCPASIEAGKKTTCEKCGRCNGSRVGDRKNAANVTIIAHGASGRRFRGESHVLVGR